VPCAVYFIFLTHAVIFFFMLYIYNKYHILFFGWIMRKIMTIAVCAILGQVGVVPTLVCHARAVGQLPAPVAQAEPESPKHLRAKMSLAFALARKAGNSNSGDSGDSGGGSGSTPTTPAAPSAPLPDPFGTGTGSSLPAPAVAAAVASGMIVVEECDKAVKEQTKAAHELGEKDMLAEINKTHEIPEIKLPEKKKKNHKKDHNDKHKETKVYEDFSKSDTIPLAQCKARIQEKGQVAYDKGQQDGVEAAIKAHPDMQHIAPSADGAAPAPSDLASHTAPAA